MAEMSNFRIRIVSVYPADKGVLGLWCGCGNLFEARVPPDEKVRCDKCGFIEEGWVIRSRYNKAFRAKWF